MKISELVGRLNEIQNKYGDLEFIYPTDSDAIYYSKCYEIILSPMSGSGRIYHTITDENETETVNVVSIIII